MNIRYFATLFVCVIAINTMAQSIPSIAPEATYIDATGVETNDNNFSGSAPLIGKFTANPTDDEGWNANYEWRFYTEGNQDSPYLTRFEQDTQYEFTTAGTNYIVLYATFTQGSDTIAYTKQYWDEVQPMTVIISTSNLEMPNAFSPNGDGINDIYKAKEGYKSIVEFKATIFNRWGQKLYEWNDPAGGWDGKFNGKDVAQGAYFVLVKAKGADGRIYNIRRDVNILRGYIER